MKIKNKAQFSKVEAELLQSNCMIHILFE